MRALKVLGITAAGFVAGALVIGGAMALRPAESAEPVSQPVVTQPVEKGKSRPDVKPPVKPGSAARLNAQGATKIKVKTYGYANAGRIQALTAEGKPAAGIEIKLTGSEGAGFRIGKSVQHSTTVKTDANGFADVPTLVAGAKPGTYKVTAKAGLATVTYTVTVTK